MILQSKATCQHCIEHVGHQQWYEGQALFCWKMHPGIVIKIDSTNQFNHQSDIQTCIQSDRDNNECSCCHRKLLPDHNSSLTMLKTAWLQALTWPLSNQHMGITGTMTETALIGEHKILLHNKHHSYSSIAKFEWTSSRCANFIQLTQLLLGVGIFFPASVYCQAEQLKYKASETLEYISVQPPQK